jgi:TonB family protein
MAASGCGGRRQKQWTIIESASETDTTRLGVGKEHLAKKRYPDARRCFREAVKQEPENWEAHLFLGRAHGEFGQMDSASEEFWRALDLVTSQTQEKTVVRAMRYYEQKHSTDDRVGGCAFMLERFENFDVHPEVIEDAQPEYPESARKAEVEGVAIVTVTVGRFGTVIEACVAESLNPVFDQPALDAANQFRFNPALLDGNPVLATIDIPFKWSLAH